MIDEDLDKQAHSIFAKEGATCACLASEGIEQQVSTHLSQQLWHQTTSSWCIPCLFSMATIPCSWPELSFPVPSVNSPEFCICSSNARSCACWPVWLKPPAAPSPCPAPSCKACSMPCCIPICHAYICCLQLRQTACKKSSLNAVCMLCFEA